MTLGAVLFDLDDTLHDKSATLSRVGEIQHAEAGLAALGVDLGGWLHDYIELNNRRIEKTEVFSKLASTFGLPAGLEAKLREDFDANLGKLAVPFAGTHELLAWCKDRGLKVGIVTNGRDAFQRSKITGMGLSGVIDAILTSGGFGVKKPGHAIFFACLEQLGVHPADAAFVGDDLHTDMEHAIALGMLPIGKSATRSERVAFSSRVMLSWAHARSVQLFLIEPGKPNQNAYIESFNGRFRDECLNEHWFTNLQHVRVVVEAWRKEYNEERPKRSLGGLTPVAYAKTLIQKQLN